MFTTKRFFIFVAILSVVLAIWYGQGRWQLHQLEQERAEIKSKFMNLEADIMPDEKLPQLWAHRGYHRGGAAENSLEALAAAVDRGFWGVELDVFWGPPLIVQRAIPSRDQLSRGEYLRLQSFYEASPDYLFFYLDVKNLNSNNAVEIATALQALFKQGHRRMNRSFVESRDAGALAILHRQVPGIRTLYWITDYRNEAKVQAAVLASGTGAVSAPAIIIDEKFLSDFSHLRVHAFTENMPQYVGELIAGGADVILTDVDLSDKFPDLMYPEH